MAVSDDEVARVTALATTFRAAAEASARTLGGADLAAACGVADAAFAHLRRFMGAARSREGALAMAAEAIGIGPGPRE
jgi:uncharacterized UPF0160 family protein